MSRSQRKRQQKRHRAATVPKRAPAVAAASLLADAIATTPILPAAAGRPASTTTSTSTGPITPEGKLISRANSLKHGLTARTLILQGEDPDEIRAKADHWRDSYMPEGAAEEALVDQIALESLRLERIARAEYAALSGQLRNAEIRYDLKQIVRLLKSRRLLGRDRIIAILKLRSFGAGVSWLLERWKVLESAFQHSQCWTSVIEIREAIRLRGLHDERLSSGYEFAHLAVSCVEDHQNKKELLHFLQNYCDDGAANVDSTASMRQIINHMASYIPDECLSRAGVRELSVTEARRTMRTWLDRQLAELRELDRHFKEADAEARVEASALAMVLDDTPKNRLIMRYMRSAELAQNRAMRTLTVLQNERKKAAKNGEKVALPNEPVVVAEVPAKDDAAMSSVMNENAHCGSEHVSIDSSKMESIATTVVAQPLEVAARVENGL
jgi:hypothetical protein